VHAACCQQLDWRLAVLIIYSIQDYIYVGQRCIVGNPLSNAPFVSPMNYSCYKRKYRPKLLVCIVRISQENYLKFVRSKPSGSQNKKKKLKTIIPNN